jgi:hypothetical protein
MDQQLTFVDADSATSAVRPIPAAKRWNHMINLNDLVMARIAMNSIRY